MRVGHVKLLKVQLFIGRIYKQDATKIGYEVSFTRHFYKPQPLRTLEEIRADILAVEREAEGLLDELLGLGAAA